MSKNIARVTLLMKRSLRMELSSRHRGSRVEKPGRKPHWNLLIRLLVSRWNLSLVVAILSKVLQRKSVREMGRKEEEERGSFVGFRIGKISASFQEGGRPLHQKKLKIARSLDLLCVSRFFISWGGISSGPGELEELLWMDLSSSDKVKLRL